MSLELCSSLRGVRGVGLRRAEGLASAGITTVQDLLFTLPFRYEDRSRFVPLAEVTPGKRVTVSGSITTARLRRTRVKGFTLFDLVVADPTGDAAAVWYNQPYLRNVLRMGERVVLFGESTLQEKGRWRLLFKNPEFELLAEDPERIHTGRIVPIYRRTGGLSTRMLRTLIHRALDCLPPKLPDPLPHSLVLRLGLADRATALRQTHFPMPGTPLSLLEEGRTLAHRRLALEELYGLQRDFARSRSLRACCKGIPFPVTQAARRNLTALSPFSLTAAQERALREILADLAEPRPMFRLLQGDVGCGKTLVALLASVAVMEQGGQVALMVPTEILAEQHHRRALDLLEGTGHAVALLTSQSRSDSDGNLLPTIAGGEVGMVVGTHALIQEAVRFRRLGLVVVDEQHRFGVRQRELLRDKGTEPHQLFMTATPIPRSLALAFYGDLDVTRIDEMPPGRLPVRTLLRKPADREKIYRFIRKEVDRGGKAAIIVPLGLDRFPQPAVPAAVIDILPITAAIVRILGASNIAGILVSKR